MDWQSDHQHPCFLTAEVSMMWPDASRVCHHVFSAIIDSTLKPWDRGQTMWQRTREPSIMMMTIKWQSQKLPQTWQQHWGNPYSADTCWLCNFKGDRNICSPEMPWKLNFSPSIHNDSYYFFKSKNMLHAIKSSLRKVAAYLLIVCLSANSIISLCVISIPPPLSHMHTHTLLQDPSKIKLHEKRFFF